MPGMLDWKIKISADIKDLQNKMHKVEGKLGEFEGKDHKVKLDLDTKTLESALKKLDSMLDSLGKGTGDFKQFETLSKDLAKVTSELSGFTKAFGKIDNSGTKSLLDMVQNIDKSLNNLSSHVTDEFLNKITSSIGTVKQKFADIGDGSEFEPLLQMINKIDSSINNLAKETSKIKLNMNLDFGTEMSEKMNQQVSKAVSRQAQAYKNLFEIMKGSGKTTEEMIKFSLPENASNSEIVGAYKGVIERAEKQYGKSTYSLRLGSKYNDAKNEVKNANAALRRAEIKRTNSNGVSDLLGGNFGDVINELSKIAAKLDEISSSASGLKSAFETGFNVSASVEEIAQLTNKVKKLEDELQKVKSVSSGTVSTDVTLGNESNISSERKDAIQTDGSSATNASTSAIKEENNVLDQTAQSAEIAANNKKKFAKANKEVKDSADTSKTPIKNEADALKEVANSTNQLNIIQAKSDSTYWQNRFKESVKDMTSTNDELVKMKKYYQDMSNEAQKAYDVFEKQKKSYSDKLTKYTDTSKYTSDFVNRANSLKSKIETFDFTKPQDVARLREIDSEVVKISNDSKLLENKLIKQQSKLAEIVSQMRIFKSQNTNMLNSQKAELDQIINYAETMRKSGKEVASEVEKIKVQFAGLKARVNESGNTGKNFFSQISTRLTDMNSKFVAQFLSLQDWIRYIQQGINTVRELDEAMTEVRKVSEASESQYESFQNTVASTAKEIASTNKELLNSSADFLRLGYSLDQAEDLAKNATLFVNVGDGVDITEATEDMITAMKAFDIQAEDSIKIVDDYNQIGKYIA